LNRPRFPAGEGAPRGGLAQLGQPPLGGLDKLKSALDRPKGRLGVQRRELPFLAPAEELPNPGRQFRSDSRVLAQQPAELGARQLFRRQAEGGGEVEPQGLRNAAQHGAPLGLPAQRLERPARERVGGRPGNRFAPRKQPAGHAQQHQRQQGAGHRQCSMFLPKPRRQLSARRAQRGDGIRDVGGGTQPGHGDEREEGEGRRAKSEI